MTASTICRTSSGRWSVSPTRCRRPEPLGLVTLTGRYYQIRDDNLNLTSSDGSPCPIQRQPIVRPIIKSITDSVRQYISKKGFLRRPRRGKILALVNSPAQTQSIQIGLLPRFLTRHTSRSSNARLNHIYWMPWRHSGPFEYTRGSWAISTRN